MTKKAKATTLARITVFPRPEILDPQGTAIAQSLGRLGFDKVADVRAGKCFDVSLNGLSGAKAEKALAEMAKKLFANEVVEDFTIELLDEDES